MPRKARGNVVILQDWFVRDRHIDDFYRAPELNYKVLAGEVYGHPRFPEGYSIKTSRPISVEGRFVTTKGGTTYRLGRIQKGYREWLRKEGLEYNPKQPIVIR